MFALRSIPLVFALLVVAEGIGLSPVPRSFAEAPASPGWIFTKEGLPVSTYESAPAGSALPDLPPRREVDREALPAGFLRETPASLDELMAMETHVKALVARLSPAVVAVMVGGGTGSGVIISEDGLVLTAAHVSGEPGQRVRFTLPDGRTATGKTLGANYGIDSGLMKITEEGPWPHVEFGDLEDAVPGDWVLALGHPGGFDPERPIVARLGRIISIGRGAVRTDCPLLGGDSGGPLFDMHGRVVGIHSRISESTAANFHVPIDTFADTWRRLVSGETWGARGRSQRPYVGARGVEHPDGFQLQSIEEGSPADKAGLRVGDIIVTANGERITDYGSFRRYVSRATPGDEVVFAIKRDDQELEIKVKVETRPRGRR